MNPAISTNPHSYDFDFDHGNFPEELRKMVVDEKVATAGEEKAHSTVFSPDQKIPHEYRGKVSLYQRAYLKGSVEAVTTLKQVSKRTNGLVKSALRNATQHTLLSSNVAYADTKNTIRNFAQQYGNVSLLNLSSQPNRPFLIPLVYVQRLNQLLSEANKVHIACKKMSIAVLRGTFWALIQPNAQTKLPVTHLQGLKLDFSDMALLRHPTSGIPLLESILDTIKTISRNNPHIEIDLDFSFIELNDAKAKIIAEKLTGVKGVKALRLGYNHMGNNGLKAIAGMLRGSDIEVLDIHDNNAFMGEDETTQHGIGNEGMMALFDAIPHSRLKELNANGCAFGIETLRHMQIKLRECHTLTHLHLADNHINAEGMAHFSKGLQRIDQDEYRAADDFKPLPLEYLDVSGNKFGSAGFKALGEGISTCPQLKHLEARNCVPAEWDAEGNDEAEIDQKTTQQIGNMASFAEDLTMRGDSLKTLILHANYGLADESIALVIKKLPQMQKLEILDISETFASEDTAEALNTVELPSHLRELNIDLCAFGVAESEKILKKIAGSSLQVLKMSGISLDSHEDAKKVTGYLGDLLSGKEGKCLLTRVEWCHNGLHDADLRIIFDALEKNPDNILTHLNIGQYKPDTFVTFSDGEYDATTRSVIGGELNQLTNDGITFLGKALPRENCKVSHIGLQGHVLSTANIMTLLYGSRVERFDDIQQFKQQIMEMSAPTQEPTESSPRNLKFIAMTVPAAAVRGDSSISFWINNTIPWVEKHCGVHIEGEAAPEPHFDVE